MGLKRLENQRLKSESSGDWQKEKDQTPIKKALFKRLSLNLVSSFSLTKNTKKEFFIKPPQKTQRLKSESSGDWQKEKDQTKKKKRV